MFGNNIVHGISFRSILTLPKIISGISKSLGIINQAIPLYQQIKPTLSKSKEIINILNQPSKSKNIKRTLLKSKKNAHNSPTFFQ